MKKHGVLIWLLVFSLIAAAISINVETAQALSVTEYCHEGFSTDDFLLYTSEAGGTNSTEDYWFGHSIESSGVDGRYLEIYSPTLFQNDEKYIMSQLLNTFPVVSHTQNISIGFWFRGLDPGTPLINISLMHVRLMDSVGSMGIDFDFVFDYPPASNNSWQVQPSYTDEHGVNHQYPGWIVSGKWRFLQTGSWYWFDASVYWTGASYTTTARINGTALGGFSGDLTSFSSPYVQFSYIPHSASLLNFGWFDLDDVRITDNWQFPPPSSGEPAYPYVTAQLENIDSGDDWVFTDWKYYVFTVHVPAPWVDLRGDLTGLDMRFNVSTGETEIMCDFYVNNTDREHSYLEYSYENWTWTFNSSLTAEEETRFGQPLNLQAGIVSHDATNNETDITLLIFFNKQILDAYTPAMEISPLLEIHWANYTMAWYGGGLDFYIYSKGGFTKNFYSSDAARANCLAGEEWAALYAYNGSNVENEIWFRDLQHIKMLPYVQGYTGLDPFSISFTMDYSVGEGEWLPGWECTITPMTIHWTGLFAQEVWINMTVNWYQGTGTPGAYTLVKTEYLYMFFHGSVTGSGQPFAWRFWFDAWFNSINASSTGGGRINAFEYPMKDDADLWFRWLANNWGVKDDVAKESTYMADLKDTDNLIMSSERIKMVRFKVALIVYEANSGQLIQLHDYEVLDYTHSKELPLHGIQTPVFDDTKMPDVGQTGLLGALFSVFAGIGQWLSENVMFGGLNLWGNFVAFLDTIAGWLGAPKFFTNLFNWIGSGFTYLSQSATYVFTLLYNFFLMIGQLMGAFITTLGEFVLSIITTLGYLVDFLGGIGTGAGNLWDQFQIWSWMQLALIFYPIYLIILWEEHGMDAVLSQLTMIWGIASWLFGFFIQIIMAVISFAHTLIESIPVAE